MGKVVRSFAKPAMLAWCRKTARVTSAAVAQSLKIDEARVIDWESGKASPSFAQLKKLAQIYKRPTCVFYLPSPPTDFTVMRDFRSMANTAVADFSPQLALAIRESKERVNWMSEYLQAQGSDAIQFVGSESVKTHRDAVAKRMRKLIGVTIKEQATCDSMDTAFRLWRRRIELTGVCVFALPRIDVEEMRGFAIVNKYAPSIAVNSRDSSSAKIFTLLHEFVHILIGKEGVSDGQNESIANLRDRRIEEFCNSVAVEVAMPSKHLQKLLPKARDLELHGIPRLSRFYKISEIAVATKLLEIGEIDRGLYQHVWALSQSRKASDKKKGSPPPFIKARSQVGAKFATAAITAFRSGELDGADLSHFIKLRLHHLESLEAAIQKFDIEPEATP